MMSALSALNVGLLFWTGLGALCAGALLIGLVRFLLKRYAGWVYLGVMGLMAGTVLTSLPRVPLEAGSLLYLFVIAAGALTAAQMAKMADAGEG